MRVEDDIDTELSRACGELIFELLRYEVASRKYLTVIKELFVVAESKQRFLLLEEL